MNRMPVIFSGHGDPMIALRRDAVTEGLQEVGDRVIRTHGKPRAILSLSAHWYVDGTYIQSAEHPEQIYDMHGFPRALYEVKYPVRGCSDLTERVRDILKDSVSVNDRWGIDHGTWTVLVHMFPDASIPVVQLSLSRRLPHEEGYELGKRLAVLRDEGCLILGSGNVVHNLRRIEWENPHGTEMAERFNRYVVDRVAAGDESAVVHYETAQDAEYAVPTPDHYLPLIYCLGAAGGDKADVFNNVCNLGSLAMTGFAFGLK